MKNGSSITKPNGKRSMTKSSSIRVAVNGYGVIGKRVADAIAVQDDLTLADVADLATDWQVAVPAAKGYALFGATGEYARAMGAAGLDVAGDLDDLLSVADIVVDCTPAPRPKQRFP
jgi:glyceraldehyde-3-phosphate dehydrogenase (NAD(P))